MKRVGRATIVVFAVWLAGCTERSTGGPDPTQVSEAFAAAYNARDVVRIASLYTEDAELMPPDEQPIKGRAAIEALFREKFQQNCAMELRSSASEIAGSQGFDTGTMAITMSAPDGTSQRVAGRYLAVVKRVGSEWKIAYHMQTVEPE